MEICSCESIMGNLGVPKCYAELGLASGIIFVSKYANDGTKNVVDITDTLDMVYFEAKVSHADPSKRWYFLPKLEEFATTRAEPVIEESSSGRKRKVKDGARDVTFQKWEGGAQLKAQLDKGGCSELSFFAYTSKMLIGMEKVANEMAPIDIESGSFFVNYFYPTTANRERLDITLQFSQDEYDGALSFITPESDVLFTELRSPIDIYSTVSAITTTGFTVKMFTKYGALNDRGKDAGLVLADFVVFNTTDSAVITATSVTETVDGTYVFVIPATVSKTIRLTPSAEGRDYANVVANTFVTPAS